VKKYLNVYNCNTIDEFRHLNSYKEDSHPFSYILLSSALLHSSEFIAWLDAPNARNDLRKIVKEAFKSKVFHDSILKTKEISGLSFFFKVTKPSD
jgi:hypothetical protein